VGRAKAAREALEWEQELLQVRAERELMESVVEARRTRSVGLEVEEAEELPFTPAQQRERDEVTLDRPKNLAGLSVCDLQRVAAADAKLVARLASKSKNLKGTFQRALKRSRHFDAGSGGHPREAPTAGGDPPAGGRE